MSFNPLLTKVKIPGKIFQLPSKGVFYKEGVLKPSIKDGEIQIKPMSALAEMKLRNIDLLFNGLAFKEICEECITDILDPSQLLSKDVDAIFLFLRIVTYNAILNISTMHNCKNEEQNHQIDLSLIVNKPNNEILEYKDINYKVKLSEEIIVNLKPINFQDSLDVAHMRREIDKMDNDKPDYKIIEKLVVRDLMSAIENVEITFLGDDGETKNLTVSDKKMIEEWTKTLTKKETNAIISQMDKASTWGYDLSTKLKCKLCGESFDYQLQLDPINFFYG